MRKTVIRINDFIGRYLVVIIVVGLTAGFFLDEHIAGVTVALPYILIVVVFVMGTSCTLESFRSIAQAPKGFIVALLVIFICMPIIGYLMGYLFHRDNPSFAVGHFLLSVTPVAITSMIWTGIAGGNIALSLALVTVGTLVSGFNIPLQMSLFMGKVVQFDTAALAGSLSKTIVIPVLLGLAVRNRAPRLIEPLRPYMDLMTKVALVLILSVNGAVVRPYISSFDWEIVRLFLLVGVHNFLNFSVSLGIAWLALGRGNPAMPAVVYAASMKNNAAGVVVALNYFGPIVALPVVITMLMQQLWAGGFYRIIRRMKHQKIS
jgi:bile acid:Na+ symporter, BASS family